MAPMPEPTFLSAAVIGAGMMGPGIAVTLALGGLRTTIVDLTDEGARAGAEKACVQLDSLLRSGLADAPTCARARQSIDSSAEFDATVARADLVIESVPEKMELKKEVFARMDSVARPETVLATNTSGLSVTAIASGCRRPERVMTTHFWNPAFLMPLVEVVLGEKTSLKIAEAVRDLMTRCGKTAVIVKKDRPGQLGNRLQMALWREAMHIVAEGIADPEAVDLAAKMGFGLRLPVYGIFEHADAVGLDMILDIISYVSQDLYSEPRAPQLIYDLVARGELGAKSGKGFYDWSQKDIKEVIARRDEFVLEMARRRRRPN